MWAQRLDRIRRRRERRQTNSEDAGFAPKACAFSWRRPQHLSGDLYAPTTGLGAVEGYIGMLSLATLSYTCLVLIHPVCTHKTMAVLSALFPSLLLLNLFTFLCHGRCSSPSAVYRSGQDKHAWKRHDVVIFVLPKQNSGLKSTDHAQPNIFSRPSSISSETSSNDG